MTDTDPRPASPRYLRVTETAVLVRRALKPAFPGIKFSVTSDSYSGGASIRVKWNDGPTTSAVDDVVGAYAGAGFDGSIDLKYGRTTWLCTVHGARRAATYGHSYASVNGPADSRCCHRAELVHMGADYVHTVRSYTDAARTMLEGMAARSVGHDTYDPQARDPWNQDWMTAHFHRIAGRTPLAVDAATGDPVVVADPAARPAVPAAR